MKKLTSIVILFFSFTHCFAQQQLASNWCFGYKYILDFNTMDFIAEATPMLAFESAVSISDTCGNLLFYSNGGAVNISSFEVGGVWNRNHELMPNGDLRGFGGCSSSKQGVLALPDPGNENEYYLFKVDCGEHIDSVGYGSLNYSKIDMLLDGGLGDVTQKQVPLSNLPMSEMVTAVKHASRNEYWLIAPDLNDTLWVYRVSSSGVQLDSSYYFSILPRPSVKASPDGTKLFCGALYDFDNATGVISNPIDLGVDQPYAIEFSPNSNYLYIVEMFYDTISRADYYQFDLTASNIPASIVPIDSIIGEKPWAFQLAPNGVIYSRNIGFNLGTLHAILSPDAQGLAANFQRDVLTVPDFNMLTHCQFPNYVSSWLIDSTGCPLYEPNYDIDLVINIFPNPVSHVLRLGGVSTVDSILITDLQGKAVKETKGQTEINVSGLSEGLYLINIKTTLGTVTKKFVKQ